MSLCKWHPAIDPCDRVILPASHEVNPVMPCCDLALCQDGAAVMRRVCFMNVQTPLIAPELVQEHWAADFAVVERRMAEFEAAVGLA